MTAYAVAFQNDPTSHPAAVGAARCAMQISDKRAATTWAMRAVDLSPDDLAARMMLARLLAEAGLKSRARTELTQLLNRSPDHKEAKQLLRTL